MYEYLVTGSVIVDNIIPYRQKIPVAIQIGGGAVYALSGIKLWSDKAFLAAYGGEDFDELYGAWMENNQFSSDGIVTAFDKTCHTNLNYLADGTYDSDCKLVPLTSPNMELIEPCLHSGLKGVHVLMHGNVVFFERLNEYRKKYGFKVGYEWATSPTFYRGKKMLREVANHYCDYFSMSMAELQELYPEITDVNQALDFLMELNCAVFFRMGTDGAYMIENGRAYRSPMVSVFGNADPTGCGNTSTAAAFWAYCEGKPPLESGMIGAVTASLNARYVGLVPAYEPGMRAECERLVQKLVADTKGGEEDESCCVRPN